MEVPGTLAVLAVVLTLGPGRCAGSLFVTDPAMSRMVSFNDLGRCFTHLDRGQIVSAVMSSARHQVKTAPPREVKELMGACLRHNSLPGTDTRRIIYPGTKWCGTGNKARSADDLGPATAEDRCCRDHDFCPISLGPGQCRGSVCNLTPFTRSECKCDQQFMSCLKAVGSSVADTIGKIYFNIVKVKCFYEDAQCGPKGIVDCSVREMPYYETSSSTFLNNLVFEIVRGVIRLKHNLFRYF